MAFVDVLEQILDSLDRVADLDVDVTIVLVKQGRVVWDNVLAVKPVSAPANNSATNVESQATLQQGTKFQMCNCLVHQ
jgi:hypothetical protein